MVSLNGILTGIRRSDSMKTIIQFPVKKKTWVKIQRERKKHNKNRKDRHDRANNPLSEERKTNSFES